MDSDAEMTKPIDIRTQKPILGQRCQVYDNTNRQWRYAYWMQSQSLFEKYCFGTVIDDVTIPVNAIYWMPEPLAPDYIK